MVRYAALVIFFLPTILMIIGCGGGKNITLQPEEGTEIRIYEVFGMDCPGCHGGLEKLINKIPGVMESQANWQEQSLAVRIKEDSELSDDEIFEAVRKANFTPGKRLN
jgi:copper chaperone CopZ